MDKKRQDILRVLLEEFHHALKEMHSGQCFPFGTYLLSHQQVVILFYAGRNNGGVAVKELAKLMHVTPGAVTQFVDALVEKKLVIREIGSSDRRSINIKLSPLAKKQFSQFKKSYFIEASRGFRDFSVAELEQLSRLLAKIKIIKS